MSYSSDPERDFENPGAVLADDSLQTEEKLRILEDWRLDLIELQRAEEENMPSARAESGATAKQLAEVARVMAVLKEARDSKRRAGST